MLKHFSSRRGRGHDDGDRTTLIEIYLREKMLDSALKEVLARRDLRVLGRYYKQLAERYPEEYFKMYSELLLPYAEASGDRGRYSEVVSQLKKMKAIIGFELEFRKYVEMLRRRYARRPAFLDELKGL
ncbi:MAG: hypothetical protein OK474_06575 [Thaumarchaeota archaeon]|nr:hypothetical protein [Nitrososphaerota archaeon]